MMEDMMKQLGLIAVKNDEESDKECFVKVKGSSSSTFAGAIQ
jgi:hypothetical protein